MMLSSEQLLQEALRLSPDQRVDLAGKLLDSVDVGDAESDPGWSDELKRRMDDMRTGKVKGMTWEETMRFILDDTDDAAASS
ncbi:MAG: addiction module protein [Gemmataceae bacterium]